MGELQLADKDKGEGEGGAAQRDARPNVDGVRYGTVLCRVQSAEYRSIPSEVQLVCGVGGICV